jgi:membrane protein required for colicin V production
MIIDLSILFPLIVFGALGFRDGSVRKIVAITVAIIGMFLSQFLMHPLAEFLIDSTHVQAATAPMTAFSMVFFMLFFLQSVLYRFLTDNYKIGKIVDRVVGVVFGTIEGLIVISVVIFILTMRGPPSRKTIWDSRLYVPTASIAPQIMDFVGNLGPMATKSFEKLTSPEEEKVDSTLRVRPQ